MKNSCLLKSSGAQIRLTFSKERATFTMLTENSDQYSESAIALRVTPPKQRGLNRSDFDRWFEHNRKRLLENVRMIFEAGPTARVQVTEGEGAPVRIDPTAPDAQPVYDLLTPDPFRDLEQELVGGIKAWKTSGQFLNETQILKAYGERGKITDPEVLELILRSCWEHRLHGYYWAARIHPPSLFGILEEVIVADRYPASGEALKVAILLPRTWAKSL
ncbi:MAG: hypothetical protein WCA38_17415 [Candidatus Acidiferrales bacterium]